MIQPVIHHVAVVGGGPAGATAAFLLARRGFTVTLFDRQHFPRPKVCAGLLTWKTIRLLETLSGDLPHALRQQGIIVQSCRDYRIYFGRRELARGRLEVPFHLVDRLRYDCFWLEKARRAGAQLHLGLAVTSADPTGTLCTADGREHRFDAIIGADGVSSRIRLSVNGSKGARHRWRANLAGTIEVRCPAPDRDNENCACLHFGYAPWGYAWSFPSPEGRVVGICALQPKRKGVSLKAAFGRYLCDWGMEGIASDWQSHPLPYGNYLAAPGQGRVLLAGDACGLADPLLGEGIYYAHRSAQCAAQALTLCRDRADGLAGCYTRLLNRSVLRDFRWISLYRGLLFFGGRYRRFRSLRLFFRCFPKRLESLVQGTRPFSRLLLP
jgi:menaquinone-9 beta-reductase